MRRGMKISTNTRPNHKNTRSIKTHAVATTHTRQNTKKKGSENTKGAAKSLEIMESMLSSITPYHKGSIKTATIAVSLFIRAVNTRGFLLSLSCTGYGHQTRRAQIPLPQLY